jgi:hypothetical protein
METTMPEWWKLWHREPALKPLDDSHLLDVCGLPGYDTIRFKHREPYSTVIAALCRDAAVRWLAEQGIVVTPPCRVSSSPTSDWCLYRIGVHPILMRAVVDMHNGRRVGPRIKSLDDALYAACEIVLNARQGLLPPLSIEAQ